MENSRNKQFISLKLHAVLSSVMKSHTVPLCPYQVMNHPFVCCIPTAQSLLLLVKKSQTETPSSIQDPQPLSSSAPDIQPSTLSRLYHTKQRVILLIYGQKANSSLMLPPNAYVSHLNSSPHVNSYLHYINREKEKLYI